MDNKICVLVLYTVHILEVLKGYQSIRFFLLCILNFFVCEKTTCATWFDVVVGDKSGLSEQNNGGILMSRIDAALSPER